MEYVRIGKIVNTHALKGEVRIVSDFEFKDQVFVIGNKLYIGFNYNKEEIKTYRKHKNYDMVSFVGKDYIDDVINYKGNSVYVLKDTLHLEKDELIYEELLDMEVIFEDVSIGKVDDYVNNNGNKLLYVNNKYIPYNKDFIVRIDKDNKKIYYKNIGELL